MNDQSNRQQPSIEELLAGQLPRAEAPADFEDVTMLRLLLGQLPRVSAPENFEEEVLTRLAETKKRKFPRRLRLPQSRSPWHWLAAGAGVAILGGAIYYFATRTTAPTSEVLPPAPAEQLRLVIPTDTMLEETIKKPALPTVETTKRTPDTFTQPSTAPTKRITPGKPPLHEDDE